MRLYIATTSLNFDSIMATESMSPVSFYERRGFGISMFYPKVSFQMKNSILLTDAFPNYKIDNQEVEHRPLVVEIDDSNYPEGTFEKVRDNDGFSVYQASRTLYITPLSARLFFFTVRDMDATLSKADSIIEAKYALYKKLGAIEVVGPKTNYVNLNRNSFEGVIDCPDIDYKSIDFDRRVDKAKGFIVSYMIGASRALTADSVKMLRLVKDIKNVVYSIGTKDKAEASVASMTTLKELVSEAEKLSKAIDPRKLNAERNVHEFLGKLGASEMLRGSSDDEILSFLKKANLYSLFYQRVNAGVTTFSIEDCVTRALNTEDDSLQEEAISKLQIYARSLARSESSHVTLADLFSLDPDLKVIECKDGVLPSQSRAKLETLYNLFSGCNVSASELRTNRVNYVYDAGDALGIRDAEQAEKDYFNALLDNLQHAAKFDLLSSSDPVLQALAAFMKAPDMDIEKLSSLLVNSEIADARVAYGLWGLFYGYSSLSQEYYNSFVNSYENDDSAKELVEQIYSAVFKLVPSFHAVEEKKPVHNGAKKEASLGHKVMQWFGLSGSSAGADNGSDSADMAAYIPEEEYTGLINFPEEPDQVTVVEEKAKRNGLSVGSGKKEVLSTASMMSGAQRDIVDDLPSRYAGLAIELEEIIKSNVPSKEKEEYVNYYSQEVVRICRNSDTISEIIGEIKQIPAMVGKTAWNTKAKPAIIKSLKDMGKDERDRVLDRRMKESVVSVPIPMISDKDAVELVKRFVLLYVSEDVTTSTKIVDAFRKFYGDYQPGKYFYNNPNKYQRDNKSVIEHWTYWCFSEKNLFNRLPDDLRQIVGNVARQLKEFYHCE